MRFSRTYSYVGGPRDGERVTLTTPPDVPLQQQMRWRVDGFTYEVQGDRIIVVSVE